MFLKIGLISTSTLLFERFLLVIEGNQVSWSPYLQVSSFIKTTAEYLALREISRCRHIAGFKLTKTSQLSYLRYRSWGFHLLGPPFVPLQVIRQSKLREKAKQMAIHGNAAGQIQTGWPAGSALSPRHWSIRGLAWSLNIHLAVTTTLFLSERKLSHSFPYLLVVMWRCHSSKKKYLSSTSIRRIMEPMTNPMHFTVSRNDENDVNNFIFKYIKISIFCVSQRCISTGFCVS